MMKLLSTLQEKNNSLKLKFIYLYSEDLICYDFSKFCDNKGIFFTKIIGENLKYKENFIYSNEFEEILERTKYILKELIYKNEISPMKYPNNLDKFQYDMFIKKKIFNKEMKLFQGGIENSIIGLSNLDDLLSYAIKEKHSFIRILCFYSYKEHRQWIQKIKKDNPRSR